MTPRVLAVVPARGGSKGLPRKNILPLAGRPLIQHSIAAGRGCPLVTECVVSTEDEEIAGIARQAGAEVMHRPAELATDLVPTHLVVRHVLEKLRDKGRDWDVVVLLQPTSPLRTAAHLTACLEMFLPSAARSVVSVCPAEHHPYKDLRIADGWLTPLFSREALETPRQQLPAAFRPNGAIFAVRVADFLEYGAFYVDPALPFVMDARDSIDIDSLGDLRRAEAVLAGMDDA
ncbi:cytidylyltransferase domain-containing protein [Niveispirillum fermenti]|uniref:acylneuraminate cytidylyltransferase family protein n=1 Tax=Niveispirillum fermenti TaxID=1233113 RepID=UPI003A869317